MTNAADEGRERAAAADEPYENVNENDTSVTQDPAADPAQREWDGDLDPGVTGTGADPAEIPDEGDEIPFDDLPGSEEQPESQGEDPALIDLGEEGQGDVSPEDR